MLNLIFLKKDLYHNKLYVVVSTTDKYVYPITTKLVGFLRQCYASF
jgi:hypothetical protein